MSNDEICSPFPEVCPHNKPLDLECSHCLMAYHDHELQRAWQYARLLESLLKAVLGEKWDQYTLEQLEAHPSFPLL